MLLKVIVCSVGNAPKLTPAERESELKVCRCLGIERKLFLGMVSCAKLFLLETQSKKPLVAVILPVMEPVEVSVRLAEKLQLHLLELAGTEDEVAGSNLVTE